MNAWLLLDLTIRGSLLGLAALTLDRGLGRMVHPGLRRLGWAIVALGFLLPLRWEILPAKLPAEIRIFPSGSPLSGVFENPASPGGAAPAEKLPVWILLWAGGAVISLCLTGWQTWRVEKTWARRRLSTDSRLLEILEESREAAGVTAPLGLVVADDAPSPALLGWLRPKILLPAQMAAVFSTAQIRQVFLHELSHFRSMDICLGWLFLLARAIHWFNPLVYLAHREAIRTCEQAADIEAVKWSGEPGGHSYAETLVETLKLQPVSPRPFGALAIVENMKTLKARIQSIAAYHDRRFSKLAGLGTLAVLVLAALAAPSQAETENAEQIAVPAMEKWLAEIDTGRYAESWKQAAESFRTAVTEAQWKAACHAVKAPLGALESRKLASAMHQKEIPIAGGKSIQGDFVIAQFDASYQNLKYAVETVTFEKEADGTWRASGYYIKPKT